MGVRIVVLDGATLNPGDLDWSELERLGSLSVYERSGPDEVIERAREAEIILTNKTPLNRSLIEGLTALRYVGVLATGFNVVDVEAAREKEVVVTNIPSYGTESVAQMTFALLLELAQHVGLHSETVHAGEWAKCPDFCYTRKSLFELDGRTMGIVGFGRIGQAVARRARAFGMSVIACGGQSLASASEVESVALETLFKRSDVISLHCPLTKETEHLINADSLSIMKESAFLLNTSRGGLVDEVALASALANGGIAGAGLDVVGVEPPVDGSPLFGIKNCYLTPHIAWATFEARERLMAMAVENLKGFLAGSPQNVVS